MSMVLVLPMRLSVGIGQCALRGPPREATSLRKSIEREREKEREREREGEGEVFWKQLHSGRAPRERETARKCEGEWV